MKKELILQREKVKAQTAEQRPTLRKADYDIWLVGRSYALFRRAIKADVTLRYYRRNLAYFLVQVNLTTEQLVEKYRPYVVVDGEHRPNVQGQMELQSLVEEYVLHLADRVDKQEISPTTAVTIVPAVKLFLDMNDIILNWRKINKLLPRSDNAADDDAYTREDIAKMMAIADLRGKLIILLFASSGMRLEAVAKLKVGDINPVHDKQDPKRVLAAHVRVYADSRDFAYDTFITPEAWDCFENYKAIRASWGETITKDSPALIARFKYRLEDGPKPINSHTVQDMLVTLRKKAKVDVRSKHYNGKRYTVKTVHGMRKFFLTTLKSVKAADGRSAIEHSSRERLLGHRLVGQYQLEENYDKSEQVKVLLQDYLRAVQALTISDEARLALQVDKLKSDVKTYRTVEVEVAEKDRMIRELQKQVQEQAQVLKDTQEMVKDWMAGKIVPKEQKPAG